MTNKQILQILFTIIIIMPLTGCGKRQSHQSIASSDTAGELHGRPATGKAIPPGYTKVWEDHFTDTKIETKNWTAGSLRGPDGDLVPGAAGDHLLNSAYAGYVTDEDSYIDDGTLVLRNQRRTYTGTRPAGNYDYTSGWVMSMHKVSFNKGYLEIRAKFPSGDKVWPAMWLIAEDLAWGPEWDIFEYFGYRESTSNGTDSTSSESARIDNYDKMGTHLAHGNWPSVNWESHWITQYDAVYDCEAWHTYGFLWTTTKAVWYIDGKEVHRLEASSVPKGKWPNEDMYIVLNNGVRSESPDSTTVWPNYLVIDYIELYKE